MQSKDASALFCFAVAANSNVYLLMEKCIHSDDIVYAIASFLPPKDLVSLALTCKSFGLAGNNEQQRLWSRMEEAARRHVSAAKDDVKFKWRHSDMLTIEGQESWINVYNRLHLLRTSVVFYTTINNGIRCVNRNIAHIQKRRGLRTADLRLASYAICQETMDLRQNTGRYFVQFRVAEQSKIPVEFCLMRPIHSNKRKIKMKPSEYVRFCNAQDDPAFSGVNHISLLPISRDDFVGGFVVGLLLDLESRELLCFKDYEVVKTITYNNTIGHLDGVFCWAVTSSHSQHGTSVRVENNWKDTAGGVGPIPRENWEMWHTSYNRDTVK